MVYTLYYKTAGLKSMAFHSTLNSGMKQFMNKNTFFE